MKVSIRDKEALLAVSPMALSAYARSLGWVNTDTYGDHSDVYDAKGLPEIIIPRVHFLGDYVTDVSKLIDVFASVSNIDTLTLYYSLLTAEYDVFRVRAVGSLDDGSIAMDEGIILVSEARKMLSAAALSLYSPKPFYPGRPDSLTSKFLSRVRLGQTEQGSYVVKLLSPILPKEENLDKPRLFEEEPIERQMTIRLTEALDATREAIDLAIGEDAKALFETVRRGASANLCEAVAKAIGTVSRAGCKFDLGPYLSER